MINKTRKTTVKHGKWVHYQYANHPIQPLGWNRRYRMVCPSTDRRKDKTL